MNAHKTEPSKLWNMVASPLVPKNLYDTQPPRITEEGKLNCVQHIALSWKCSGTQTHDSGIRVTRWAQRPKPNRQEMAFYQNLVTFLKVQCVENKHCSFVFIPSQPGQTALLAAWRLPG